VAGICFSAKGICHPATVCGHHFVSRGPQYVETCWRTGIEAVQHLLEQGPGSNMPLSPAVTLNLYQELALLYIRYPDFDPDQRKLHGLTNEIFEQKGLAIASHNLEAEQRFHTVLGMIFVEQKTWGSDGNPRSAAYQLLRTVEVAKQRYQEE
jgi:hypothetical protein